MTISVVMGFEIHKKFESFLKQNSHIKICIFTTSNYLFIAIWNIDCFFNKDLPNKLKVLEDINT